MTRDEFKAIRQRSGLTQARIAEELGLTARTVRRIEAGDQAITATVSKLLLAISGEPRL